MDDEKKVEPKWLILKAREPSDKLSEIERYEEARGESSVVLVKKKTQFFRRWTRGVDTGKWNELKIQKEK